MKNKNKKIVFFLGIISIICVIFLGSGSCKQVVVPDGIIEVSNMCGLAIDFYLDGVFQFSVEYEATQSIEELENRVYNMEARRKGTGAYVDGGLVDVIFNRIFTWTVLSSADIKIINNYGETLGLYGDDFYSGDVEDQDYVTLQRVPYGDHKLEVKTADDTVVATTTISILVDLTYEWTINK